MDKPTIGLALSGGGARGLAHIGVLKVLCQAGIPIDYISGTSMGAVIAAAFACGIPIDAIEEKALKLSQMREMMRLIDLSPPRRGLLEGTRVRDFLADFFLDRSFETLRIPLSISAVDLITTREIVFTSGLVLPAVMASIAVPGLFPPVPLGPYRLVDGGILNNLPVDRVRELGAGAVIAVDALFDLASTPPGQGPPETEPHPADFRRRFPVPLPEFFLDFYRAELIMIAELTREHLKTAPPDVLLHPSIPPDVGIFLGFHRSREIIAAGEQCTRENLPLIRQVIQKKEASP